MTGRYANFSTGSGNAGASNTDFQSLAQTIGTNVQKITQNVGSMKKMVQQLGTSQDSETLRSQLHQIQQYTNQLAKDTNAQLKSLAAMPQGEQGAGRLLREKLTNDFSEALHHFQLVQRAEADKEKDSVKRARAASGIGFESSSGRGGAGNLIELASPVQPQQPSQQQQQQAQSFAQMDEQVNLEMLREREQAIRKLENDIVDVNAIFKDLATMVHDQGDMIDSIEANVESAAVHVEEGVQQVAKARQHQEKARKKMFCLFLIGVIVLATLITIIVVSVKR